MSSAAVAWVVAISSQMASSGQSSAASDRAIVSQLTSVERGLQSTRYQHQPRIIPARGIYQWDCSIMVAWILERARPRARRTLPTKPLARDFYDRIAKPGRDPGQAPWLRVEGPQAIEPGDVFAWRKAEIFKARSNTGHVGFVLGKPRQHPKYASA